VDPIPTRFDLAAPLPGLVELGRVHLVAIGGAGMSGVAAILLDRGVAVSGSDAKASAVLEALRERGARVYVGHDAVHLDNVDTVVVSSAIRDDNIELAAARARGLRVLHRSQALAVTMAGSRRVAVAGASGKTTTTSMLAVALSAAGADPSFVGGGEIAQLGGSAHWGGGGVFVAEADESDGSFLVYRPEIAVVTNVQPDHLDFYGTFERVQEAYAAFAESVAPDGLLVACHDDPGSRRLAETRRAAGARVLTYGFDGGADLVVTVTATEGLGSRSLLVQRCVEHELVLSVPGPHNVLDAAAAYLVGTAGLGVRPRAMLDGLAGFTGARRRFEVLGEAAGVTVVDDYAHNPAKVDSVVGTARSVLGRRGTGRLHVLFQPHLYSRTRDFAEDFAAALAHADTVVLLDIYGAREDPMPGVTSELIGAPLRERHGHPEVVVGPARDDAVALVVDRARPGDLILTVGAGDITTLAPRILAALEGR
jgi:UDP-N-acetylmuramate--alanine ligase